MTTKPTLKHALVMLALIPAAHAGIIEPKTIWNKKRIVTCWYDSPALLAETKLESEENTEKKFDFKPRALKKRDKIKVQEVITRNFTAASTGIYFVGWKECSQTPDRDVIIMRAKSKKFLIDRPGFNGRATIGEDGVFSETENGELGFWDKSGKTPTIALYSTIINPIGPGTIVHEFGHTAGLRHEHIHEDAYQDKRCHSPFVTLDWDKPKELELPYDSAVFYTQYDPTSIMNYCWLQTQRRDLDRSENVILSPKDIQTLKSYYQ